MVYHVTRCSSPRSSLRLGQAPSNGKGKIDTVRARQAPQQATNKNKSSVPNSPVVVVKVENGAAPPSPAVPRIPKKTKVTGSTSNGTETSQGALEKKTDITDNMLGDPNFNYRVQKVKVRTSS